MRIYGLSDLHASNSGNMKHIQEMLDEEHHPNDDPNDVLLIAGDVSENKESVFEVMKLFSRRFKYVFFVPGNHEFWYDGKPQNALHKWKAMEDYITQLSNVSTKPKIIEDPETGKKILILPIFSWYKDEFDYQYQNPQRDFWSLNEKQKGLLKMFGDACKWPTRMDVPGYFLKQNKKNIDLLLKSYLQEKKKNEEVEEEEEGEGEYDFIKNEFDCVISFSHFIPRRELLSKKEFLNFPLLHRVAGDLNIDKQIRKYHSKIHVFGHSHIDLIKHIEEITYIQNSCGSSVSLGPNRKKKNKKTALTFPFSPYLLYDTKKEIIHSEFWNDDYK